MAIQTDMQILGMDESKLAQMANESMDIYENSEDPEEREIKIHDASSFLYRYADKDKFSEELEGARLRFLRLLNEPKSPEDVRFLQVYSDYLYG